MSEMVTAPAQSEISVLRKIAAQTPVGAVRGMSPVVALKAALPRAAELAMKLTMQTLKITEEILGSQAMIKAVPDDALVVVLSAKDGARGLAGFDAQFLSALIEVQTTGLVTPAPADVRPWTLTDGQMCEPFVNRLFDVLEVLLDADRRGPWFYGYRFNSKVNDRRKLSMTLEEARYLFYRCELDLGTGAKIGMFWLALPENLRASDSEGAVVADRKDWQKGLRSAVLNSKVMLNVVLHRTKIPLSALLKMKPGELIKLPGNTIETVQLEAGDRQFIAFAALGQASGMRAVRLSAVGAASAADAARSTVGLFSQDIPENPAGERPARSPGGLSADPEAGFKMAGSQGGPGLADIPEMVSAGKPGVPGGISDLPGLPDLSIDLELPDLPVLPSVAALPDPGAADDLPGLPELPSVAGLSDLPTLPDLPGLPPLPS